ncbi:MAG: M13 family metallopeptidase, partial [Muribaculaceae bacterium]|nr:M13 family metallopeptidase [Muribaculaceae bacterium]
MKLRNVMALCAASVAIGLHAEHLKSLDPKGIDPETPASADFYKHVNKGWMESHPLTPEYSRYGAFNILNDSSNNRVRRIVTGLAATNPEPGTNAYKVATLYEQGMDSVRRNQLGASPVKPLLAKIEGTTPDGMTDLLLWVHRNYASPLFSGGPQEDLANSQVYAMYLGSNSLGLGDRDYYLKDDKRNKEVRAAYEKLIEKYMTLAGYSKKDAKRIVKSVMKIETALADSALTREESRNIPALYNPYSYEDVKATWSNLPLDRFFVETMDIEAPETIIVTEPRSLNAANKLAASLSDRELKDYYAWLVVDDYAPYLSDDFASAAFDFNKVMSGVQQQRPRWKKALGVTEGFLGEAIGELYVNEYFPQSSKDYMIELVENLRNALGKHIIHLEWMSDDTKVQALKKLNKFTVKIGYPDKWKDYSELTIDPALTYADNVHNAKMWSVKEYLKKWGKPVDRTEWGMTPQT